MEMTSNPSARARPHPVAALLQRLARHRARQRRIREDAKALSRLSDHLLRDIGCEDRIGPRLRLPTHRGF